jgi:hypothetical protein
MSHRQNWRKTAWRFLKNSSAGSHFRLTNFLSAMRGEVNGVDMLARRVGIPLLSNAHQIGIRRCNQGQTFFVLGNGASANDLTQADLEIIGHGFSVGINAWPLHPFVPNCFAFEFGRYSFEPDRELVQLVRAAESKLDTERRTRLLFLRPGEPASLAAWVPLNNQNTGRYLMYGRANVFAETRAALLRDLTIILRLIRDHKMSPTVLPDNGSSVIRMVFLGLILGFKEISLVGVDLNGSQYFWEEPRFVGDPKISINGIRRLPGDAVSTQTTEERPFSVSDFLATLAPLAEEILGAQILCANPQSRLAEYLPIFSFSYASTQERPDQN